MFNVEGKIFKGKLKSCQDESVNEIIYFTIVKENGMIVAREIGNNYCYPLKYVNGCDYNVTNINECFYVETLFKVIDFDDEVLTSSRIAPICLATEKEVDNYLEVISIINEVRNKAKEMDRPLYKSYFMR